jgi:hypothetical protein
LVHTVDVLDGGYNVDETNGEVPHAAEKILSANPYENQVIGRFLVELGFEAGRGGDQDPPIVDLLQQTPLDTFLGDAVIKNRASLFMIEFKRNAESVKHEQKKWLDEFKKSIGTHSAFLQAFADVHLIAFGSADGTTVEAASYMQAVFGAVVAHPVGNLAQHVRDPAKGKPRDMLLNYISELLKFRAAYGEGEGDGSGGGPAIIAIADVNGKRRSFGVPIASLSLEFKQLFVAAQDAPKPRPVPPPRPRGGMTP